MSPARLQLRPREVILDLLMVNTRQGKWTTYKELAQAAYGETSPAACRAARQVIQRLGAKQSIIIWRTRASCPHLLKSGKKPNEGK